MQVEPLFHYFQSIFSVDVGVHGGGVGCGDAGGGWKAGHAVEIVDECFAVFEVGGAEMENRLELLIEPNGGDF